MSKKNYPMDLWFQKYNITRVKIIISHNLLDNDMLYDYIDPKLHFYENIANIIENIRRNYE